MKQVELAKKLGISKSYLNMILKGRRQLTPQLLDKLQRIPEIHKICELSKLEFTLHAGGQRFKSSTAHHTEQ
jgi:transcriptional regulator with XRE-family HTH domain